MLPLAFLALAAAQPALQPVQMPGNAQSQMRRYPGVSDQGNVILGQALASPDPMLNNVMRQMRGVQDALVSAATAPTIDLDQVATLLKQREDLQSQYRQRLDDKLLAAMRQLSVADRAAFIRGLVTPPNQNGQGMAPPQ